jgi:hypothetical protein
LAEILIFYVGQKISGRRSATTAVKLLSAVLGLYCTFDLNWQPLNNLGELISWPLPMGVNTGIVYGTLDPMGGAINYLSLVVALVKAEK